MVENVFDNLNDLLNDLLGLDVRVDNDNPSRTDTRIGLVFVSEVYSPRLTTCLIDPFPADLTQLVCSLLMIEFLPEL